MQTINREEVAKDWAARGFSCELETDPPGKIWKDYQHPTDELWMLVDGDEELQVGNTMERPKAGQEVFIPANTRHTVANIGQTTAHWLYGYKQ